MPPSPSPSDGAALVGGVVVFRTVGCRIRPLGFNRVNNVVGGGGEHPRVDDDDYDDDDDRVARPIPPDGSTNNGQRCRAADWVSSCVDHRLTFLRRPGTQAG